MWNGVWCCCCVCVCVCVCVVFVLSFWCCCFSVAKLRLLLLCFYYWLFLFVLAASVVMLGMSLCSWFFCFDAMLVFLLLMLRHFPCCKYFITINRRWTVSPGGQIWQWHASHLQPEPTEHLDSHRCQSGQRQHSVLWPLRPVPVCLRLPGVWLHARRLADCWHLLHQ